MDGAIHSTTKETWLDSIVLDGKDNIKMRPLSCVWCLLSLAMVLAEQHSTLDYEYGMRKMEKRIVYARA
jgi:hypothetical protein